MLTDISFIKTIINNTSIFYIPAPPSSFPAVFVRVTPCRCFLSSYPALLPSALLFCPFMPPSFDPLSGLSPHGCFVVRGVKGCCYQRLAGLTSAVLGRLALISRESRFLQRTRLFPPPANYTLIAPLQHSPIRVGPFWNQTTSSRHEVLSPFIVLCVSSAPTLCQFVLSPKCCCYESLHLKFSVWLAWSNHYCEIRAGRMQHLS